METVIALVLTTLSFFFGSFLEHPDSSTVTSGGTTAQVIKVIDGDTIKVQVEGEIETVRYIGVDTPEPYRDGEPACYSFEATEFNRSLVAGKEVRLESDQENRDKYDRLLRYVYIDDVFVNQELVAQGYATSLTIRPNTAYAELFQELEMSAQSTNVGMWSACNQYDL